MAMPLDSTSTARTSLARSTLIKMGVRIAVVIALTTLASYLHIFQSLRTEALLRLERNVTERSLREQAIFVLAEDNQAVLKTALEERLQALSQEDPGPRFDSLFVSLPDGTVRNRPERFDGKRMPGVFIPRGVVADAEVKRRLLAAYDVLLQYGPAFHVRFTNSYITLPGGAIALYWPERPTWCQEAAPDMVSSDFEFFTVSLPSNNPRRQTAWTGIFSDPVAQAWMVSVSTPVDVAGQHAMTISHDILIQELMARTINDRMPGTYNMLFRGDGQLIAHPELKMDGATEAYNILNVAAQPGATTAQLGAGPQAHLLHLFQRVKQRSPDQVIQQLEEHAEYAAISELKGPGWLLVTVLPEHVVSSAAFRAARYVLLFGIVSLLLELGIMYWVLKQQITQPLLGFTQATTRLSEGDFKVSLNTSRSDELGQLANAFQQMAQELKRREEALKQANEGLEHRVEERTQELKQVHRQLVETARQVGRAEIATNVLHNVGNVLNSVNTAALLARERLARLKIDSMERVVGLFEEHRGNLATFLTQDERGQTALDFLGRLGKHMQGERQQIQTLLGDVSRHTEHIGAIVKLQQRYARTTTELFERVNLVELVEDALRINQAALGRHAVKVEMDLADLPPVLTEKHKVLMILVNLISNAKYALDSTPEGERRITVSLKQPGATQIHIEVRDNGVGIAPEMIQRIFQYGFTTRQEGHGFGLHSSALAAQELGGSLKAYSAGPGQGATFTLELPATPEEKREQASA
jgi:signal transduction histidine kinase